MQCESGKLARFLFVGSLLLVKLYVLLVCTYVAITVLRNNMHITSPLFQTIRDLVVYCLSRPTPLKQCGPMGSVNIIPGRLFFWQLSGNCALMYLPT
jgi:hypothetical protein